MENKSNTSEIRIDVTRQTPEELALASRHAQLIFKFNHTMPDTTEYDRLMHEIFPTLGQSSHINTPVTAVRPHMVSIGKNVVIMPGCLMMAAGGISIDDGAMIAANVQLISNNHDLYERHIITCKPVRIGKKCMDWRRSDNPAWCHNRRKCCGRSRQHSDQGCRGRHHRRRQSCQIHKTHTATSGMCSHA